MGSDAFLERHIEEDNTSSEAQGEASTSSTSSARSSTDSGAFDYKPIGSLDLKVEDLGLKADRDTIQYMFWFLLLIVNISEKISD